MKKERKKSTKKNENRVAAGGLNKTETEEKLRLVREREREKNFFLAFLRGQCLL